MAKKPDEKEEKGLATGQTETPAAAALPASTGAEKPTVYDWLVRADLVKGKGKKMTLAPIAAGLLRLKRWSLATRLSQREFEAGLKVLGSKKLGSGYKEG